MRIMETDLDRRFLEEDPEDEIPGTIIPDEDPFEEIDAPGTSTVQGIKENQNHPIGKNQFTRQNPV